MRFSSGACIGCCPEHFVIQILDLWNKCELFKPVWSDMFLSANISQSAQQHQFLLNSEVRSSKNFTCVFPFFFSYSSSCPIKMHAPDAKTQKIEPDPNFLWRTKVLVAVCKVIDTTWGRIHFLTCENFRLSVQCPLLYFCRDSFPCSPLLSHCVVFFYFTLTCWCDFTVSFHVLN